MGRTVENSICILDLEGLSMTTLWDKENMDFLKAVIKLDSENYPEMLHQMFIINAPWAFRGAWNVIKGFLPTKVTDRIKILGENKLEVLTTVVHNPNPNPNPNPHLHPNCRYSPQSSILQTCPPSSAEHQKDGEQSQAHGDSSRNDPPPNRTDRE